MFSRRQRIKVTIDGEDDSLDERVRADEAAIHEGHAFQRICMKLEDGQDLLVVIQMHDSFSLVASVRDRSRVVRPTLCSCRALAASHRFRKSRI